MAAASSTHAKGNSLERRIRDLFQAEIDADRFWAKKPNCKVFWKKGSGALQIGRAVAIEAKVVRPTFERPHKNANSLGASQVLGLLEDGFPFVGLLHISVPEPLPADLHFKVRHISGVDSELNPIETGETSIFDPFPVYSAERQLGRLEALGLPETVAFGSIGFTLSTDGEAIAGNTIGYERTGKRNPLQSSALLQRLAEFATNRPEAFTKVRWYGARAS